MSPASIALELNVVQSWESFKCRTTCAFARSMSNDTCPLLDWGAASEAGAARAGGKGWQLATLAMSGLPVPDGFVIAAVEPPQPGEPLPASLVKELETEIRRRGWAGIPLAVRSSGAAEDSARASFAGIYRSCLNVVGHNALVKAVADVYESYWTPAAVAYRQHVQGASAAVAHDLTMAVVVMPLVRAVASGVAFTADPVGGLSDQWVIHANWGLGEALVGGLTEGDEYRFKEHVRDDKLVLVEHRLGRKSRRTVASEQGGTEQLDTPAELVSREVLSPALAQELAERVRETAYALDYTNPRYDIEWVWDGTRFWIVQARPMTSFRQRTYPQLQTQPELWSRGNSRDVVPDPLSPLDWSLTRSLLERMLVVTSEVGAYSPLDGVHRAGLFHGRLYFETSLTQWEAYEGFDLAPAEYNRLLGGHQPDIEVPNRPLRQRVVCVVRGIRYLILCAKPRRRAKATAHSARVEAARRMAQPLPTGPDGLGQLLREIVQVVRGADDLIFLQASSGSVQFMLVALVESHCPGEGYGLSSALLSGGEPSVTAAQSYELLELASIAERDQEALTWLRSPDRIAASWERELPEASPFRRRFGTFLQEYGHRAVYESYLRNPRWREAPGYLFDSIVNLIGNDPERLRARQRKSFSEALQRVRRAVPIWSRSLLAPLIKHAAIERNLRELARSTLTAYQEVARRYALAIGEQCLTAPTDVFNLTLLEVLALADGRLTSHDADRRAARRRHQIEKAFREEGPEVIIVPRVGSSAHFREQRRERPDPIGAVGTGVWTGTVVGNGIARGPACVARRPEEAVDMAPGSVLVTPSTDPSWTPLFLKAGALVMETGGYLSHGAIVAREFGIPAVANVPGVMTHVRHGEMLEVDATRGVVRQLR
ncbi:MAG TPA: PEP/pyruvate-binding domain-containing protein [Steroidobacteraceae bacterium]|jgi:pyruvate,water dikinase